MCKILFMIVCNKCEKFMVYLLDFIRKRLEREIDAARVVDVGFFFEMVIIVV